MKKLNIKPIHVVIVLLIIAAYFLLPIANGVNQLASQNPELAPVGTIWNQGTDTHMFQVQGRQ